MNSIHLFYGIMVSILKRKDHFSMLEVKINENDAGQRLDKFLLKAFPNLSKSFMYKSIRNKKIKVNRKRCEFNQVLNIEDSILLFLPPDVLAQEEKKISSNSDLHIIYEDKNLLIIDKPRGLLSQSDEKNSDCVVSRMQSYLVKTGQYNPNTEQSFSPSICNRLDRNTRGLVIGCKNANALRVINEAIASRKIHKEYKTTVVGHLPFQSKQASFYIKKEGTKAIVSSNKKDGFVYANMDIDVIEEKENTSIVHIDLHTGRFHQIRAYMSSIGHPLVGDVKYGYKGKKKNIDLFAYKLTIENIDLDLKQNVFEVIF